MLDRRKGPQPLAEVCGGATQAVRGGGRCERVARVVGSAYLQLVDSHEAHGTARRLKDEQIVDDRATAGVRRLETDARDGDPLPLNHFGKGSRPRVVHVDDGQISFGHVREDAALVGGVGRKRPVPVEVVGGDVEQYGHLRVKRGGERQLE